MKHMQKPVAILCAAVMMLSTGAWAEPAAGETTSDMETLFYENSGYGFSMGIPADWMLMDRENIDALIDRFTTGELQIGNLDASSLKAYAEEIKTIDMVVMVAPDGYTNANMLTLEVGIEVTADQFIGLIFPQIIKMNESTLTDFVQDGEPSVETYGDRDYAVLSCSYSASGLTYHMTQAYCCSGTTMYCLSFIVAEVPRVDPDAAAEAMDVMLNTLSFTAA